MVKHSAVFFRRHLVGNSFNEIDRIGKLLIFSLQDLPTKKQREFLLIHLKMTGQLVFCDEKNFVAGGHANSSKEEKMFLKGERKELCVPGKYTHIIFEFSDGSKLFFNDLRQFGYLKIVNEEKLKEIKSEFGIEPGRKNFTWENFQKVLAKRKQANIKAFLLNQKNVSGLGNIYVDESLFDAGISPLRKVSSLDLKERKKLFYSIKKIIKSALKYKGTTFSDFIDSRGEKGNFKQKLKVYGRQGLKCKRRKCQGIVRKVKIGGRGTHFCPECQK